MKLFRADLHIHTVLSPCGSLEMSPRRIVDEAIAKGLDIIAITDHNSTRQCRAVIEAGKEKGVLVIGGAEINTREEVHCVTLFEDTEKLDRFQEYIDRYLPDIPNNPDKFGYQVWVNGNEDIEGEEPRLLLSGLDQSIDEVE
ncbi:MAG: PHP domain-containing protein, partial [Bacteroidales bacterium]|nr:PHP domain-containing protein [Bacteroidales bacterium]